MWFFFFERCVFTQRADGSTKNEEENLEVKWSHDDVYHPGRENSKSGPLRPLQPVTRGRTKTTARLVVGPQTFVATTIILLCRYSGHKPRLLWTFADDVAARPAGSTVVAHNSRTPSRTYNDSMAHLQRTWPPTTIVHVVTRRRDPSAEPASYHTLRHSHHIRRTIVRTTGSRTPPAGTTRPPNGMKTDSRTTTLLRRRVPAVILYYDITAIQ